MNDNVPWIMNIQFLEQKQFQGQHISVIANAEWHEELHNKLIAMHQAGKGSVWCLSNVDFREMREALNAL